MKTKKESYPKIGKSVMLDISSLNPEVAWLVFQDTALKSGWTVEEFDQVCNFLIGKSFAEQLEIITSYCVVPVEDEMTQEDVLFMLDYLGLCTHYLCQKPLNIWDEYDRSNYESLKQKATSRIVRKYAYYSKDIKQCDKYFVDSPPTRFFETREEAESQLSPKSLQSTNIYPLWVEE